jgi:hypothetical protein
MSLPASTSIPVVYTASLQTCRQGALGLCVILRQYVSTCCCSLLRHCYLKMSFATLASLCPVEFRRRKTLGQRQSDAVGLRKLRYILAVSFSENELKGSARILTDIRTLCTSCVTIQKRCTCTHCICLPRFIFRIKINRLSDTFFFVMKMQFFPERLKLVFVTLFK